MRSRKVLISQCAWPIAPLQLFKLCVSQLMMAQHARATNEPHLIRVRGEIRFWCLCMILRDVPFMTFCASTSCLKKSRSWKLMISQSALSIAPFQLFRLCVGSVWWPSMQQQLFRLRVAQCMMAQHARATNEATSRGSLWDPFLGWPLYASALLAFHCCLALKSACATSLIWFLTFHIHVVYSCVRQNQPKTKSGTEWKQILGAFCTNWSSAGSYRCCFLGILREHIFLKKDAVVENAYSLTCLVHCFFATSSVVCLAWKLCPEQFLNYSGLPLARIGLPSFSF